MCNSLLGRPEVKEKATTYAFVRCNWLVFFVVLCACCCNVQLLSLSPISSPYPIQRPSHSPFVRRFGQGKRNWAQIICVLSPCQCCAPPHPFTILQKAQQTHHQSTPTPHSVRGFAKKNPQSPFTIVNRILTAKAYTHFFLFGTHTHTRTHCERFPFPHSFPAGQR